MEQLTTGRISLRRTGTYAGAPVAGFVTALHSGLYSGFEHRDEVAAKVSGAYLLGHRLDFVRQVRRQPHVGPAPS
ncbi:hypothetical protein [Sphingomonas oryzagri]